ncbi:hypothetical protein TYRP_013710 [Tyrophagus putrescentiae]|nr:hypothetical protein TYRP_013710 [Tyrophagus putrescentiae]
MLSKGF